jgi:branched-chain amino acid transport system substrate-binding protein
MRRAVSTASSSSFEECETGYATDRGVECYERLKGKHGGATTFQPLSTGVTFALTEKHRKTRFR